MKLDLTWKSNKSMKALFSNKNGHDINAFYLVMVYHKSKKGGFDRTITKNECLELVKSQNDNFYYVDINEVK